MAEITYEVIGYKTLKDFLNRNFVIIDDGIVSKEESLSIGKRNFAKKKYEVVKVQSSDREFIEVFKVKTLFEIKEPLYMMSDAIQGLNGLKLTDPELKEKLNRLNKLNDEIFEYLNTNYIWD